MPAKTIPHKLLEIDIFLSDKALFRQSALYMKVQYSAQCAGGRNLDRAPIFAGNLGVIDFAGIAPLNQIAVAVPGDGAERDDNILQSDRNGAFENLFEKLAPLG